MRCERFRRIFLRSESKFAPEETFRKDIGDARGELFPFVFASIFLLLALVAFQCRSTTKGTVVEHRYRVDALF